MLVNGTLVQPNLAAPRVMVGTRLSPHLCLVGASGDSIQMDTVVDLVAGELMESV